MALDEYWKKRDFKITPEPEGKPPKAEEGRSFCVQKHAATRLHYDFRLELKGVLLSWAVPKGPSYDPKDKRLAMHTEDHPLEYGPFEGVIPEGEYGGGTVLLWDRGTWEPIEDPHKGYHTGRLKFRLHGQKLVGGWTLVKIKGRDTRDDAKSWLLIKEKDETARPASELDIVEARPESVSTGRLMDEIARDRDRVWNSNRTDKTLSRPARKNVATAAVKGARAGRLPKSVPCQLATLVSEPPEGDEWLHEMKFDGYRILARLHDGTARLLSRNDKDWTDHFPSVARAVEGLGVSSALLDGEVAMVLPDGTTSFQALQNAGAPGAKGELAYFVFDLLYLEGSDLTRATLVDRKRVLRELVTGGPRVIHFSDHVEGGGRAFLQTACTHGLEGIVSKRRDARYGSGRGRDWLKVKCIRRQELVIAGYTDPEGAREGIGALLLGVFEDGTLRYAGKVGTGFTSKVLKDLEQRLRPLRTDAVPFGEGKPKGIGRPHWVEPRLVAEVAFSEWTSDGRLRHPSFQGLREDKSAKDVVREVAEQQKTEPQRTERNVENGPEKNGKDGKNGADRTRGTKGTRGTTGRGTSGREQHEQTKQRNQLNEVAGVRLTHPERVLYPEIGVTKLDLAVYYAAIEKWVMPHVKGRPLTLVRCPEGLAKACFYMKHSGVWAPPSLRRVNIQEKTKVGEYLVVDDLPGVLSLAQMGVLEIHTWNSPDRAVEKPNRVVFDLDPDPSVPWDKVIAAALEVRTRLAELGLQSFVKTTGGKGLHVVMPLPAGAGWDETLAFSRAVSERMERDAPRSYTTAMPKAARKGRILVDYLRNNRGSTSVAAYSTRARKEATVSVPITWDELPGIRPDELTLVTVPARLAKLRKDPWAEYWTSKQKLTAKIRKQIG